MDEKTALPKCLTLCPRHFWRLSQTEAPAETEAVRRGTEIHKRIEEELRSVDREPKQGP
jgi:CRISPR/Cas system-associated exonuclease Cas4 (RecB family)